MLTRADFLLKKNVAFLNHGSFGACASAVIDEQIKWQKKMELQPVEFFRGLAAYLQNARTVLAEYVGASADDLVYVTNSTYGVNVLAHALCNVLDSDANVVMTNHEYGACLNTWQYYASFKNIELISVDIPIPTSQEEALERIWAAVTPKTKVLFISHITSPTAFEFPIEALVERCRQAGIYSIIDGSHAPGHISLDVEKLGADAYTANCHKWMCAPKGSAFMWVNKRIQHLVQPLTVSWGRKMALAESSEFVVDHEYLGTRDCSAFLTVPFVLEWMRMNNWERVQLDAQQLRAEIVKRICTELGLTTVHKNESDNRLQMGTIIMPSDINAAAFQKALFDNHNVEVVVQPWEGQVLLRISTHVHTAEQDGVALLQAIKKERQP
ncbi:MAG: aminotransferase class V-fold PLP-dependent enzyme [Ignavibacteria bacterium]|nr:aminotransferase class V-fold PLP-dependent enzyme [Ignavibacteria bacterium]